MAHPMMEPRETVEVRAEGWRERLALGEWCWLMAAAGWAWALIRMPRTGSDVGDGVQGVAGGVELGAERYASLANVNVGVGLGALVEVFGLSDGVGELRLGIGESTRPL